MALDAYLEGLRHHEALLQRDEVEYVRAFAEATKEKDGEGKEVVVPPPLDSVRAKVEEHRQAIETLARSLPSEVLIGMYQLSLVGLKAQLIAKHEACVKLLLELVSTRARETCLYIQKQYTEMHERLQDQPKDIEKLTEMTEFLASLSARSAELQEAIDEMGALHDLLEEQQCEVSADDFAARWSAFHWPLKLKLKQEECERMLEEDRNLFQKEMVAQQTQFEKSLEELAYRVANFHQYTDIARVGKVTAIVSEIQQTLVECAAPPPPAPAPPAAPPLRPLLPLHLPVHIPLHLLPLHLLPLHLPLPLRLHLPPLPIASRAAWQVRGQGSDVQQAREPLRRRGDRVRRAAEDRQGL